MVQGADIGICTFIVKNLIPGTVGNIVGALPVSRIFDSLPGGSHGRELWELPAEADGPAAAAVEAGSPAGSRPSAGVWADEQASYGQAEQFAAYSRNSAPGFAYGWDDSEGAAAVGASWEADSWSGGGGWDDASGPPPLLDAEELPPMLEEDFGFGGPSAFALADWQGGTVGASDWSRGLAASWSQALLPALERPPPAGGGCSVYHCLLDVVRGLNVGWTSRQNKLSLQLRV